MCRDRCAHQRANWSSTRAALACQPTTIIHPHPHVIETGSPDARYAIVERLADTWVSTLISVPYAYRAMAKLALVRQRQDWARALSSGYIS